MPNGVYRWPKPKFWVQGPSFLDKLPTVMESSGCVEGQTNAIKGPTGRSLLENYKIHWETIHPEGGSMTEFKKGDRVRYIGHRDRPFCVQRDTGTVEKQVSGHTVWVKIDRNKKLNALEPYNLEKLASESDFKVGDKVKYTNPTFYRDVVATVTKVEDSAGGVWIEYSDGNSPVGDGDPTWCVTRENKRYLEKVEEEMSKFEVGDKVKLNPSVRDFSHGRGGVGYDEVGTVEKVLPVGAVFVHWPSYGMGWIGKVEELIHAKTKEDEGMALKEGQKVTLHLKTGDYEMEVQENGRGYFLEMEGLSNRKPFNDLGIDPVEFQRIHTTHGVKSPDGVWPNLYTLEDLKRVIDALHKLHGKAESVKPSDDDPRDLLIQFMMEKQKMLGSDVNYFTAQDVRAIMQWNEDKAGEVVGKIKAEASVGEALIQASTCPFCLYHLMCRGCDWAKNHEECALSDDLQDAVKKKRDKGLKVTQKLLDVLGKNRELKEGWVDYFLEEDEQDRPIVCGLYMKPEIYNSKEEALAARNKRPEDHICEPVKIQWYE